MLWFFERGPDTLRLHTAYDNEMKEFVATVLWSHGRRDETRFATIDAFRDWLKAFEATLEEERWESHGPPVVLPEGWPDKPLT
jgi:hypothetical protein